MEQLGLWIGFIVFILFLLALDLGVLNRKSHVIGFREAMSWTALWVSVALLFNVAVYFIYEHGWFGMGAGMVQPLTGWEAVLLYLTGWLLEYSLSLDNIFVIAVIFAYFGVPREHQHRVLFWGILGALVMRGVMIVAGVALIHRFEWLIYVFGVILLLTAVKMARGAGEHPEPDKNPLVRIARWLYPVSPHFEGEHFVTRLADGRRAITPLMLVLLVVESTDVVFAVDSIPAIIGIFPNPSHVDAFIVFSSNVFAILGLRSLYFALSGLLAKFAYMKYSLAFILFFTGIKMLLPLAGHYLLHRSAEDPLKIPIPITLGVIVASLAVGVVVSLLLPAKSQPSA